MSKKAAGSEPEKNVEAEGAVAQADQLNVEADEASEAASSVPEPAASASDEGEEPAVEPYKKGKRHKHASPDAEAEWEQVEAGEAAKQPAWPELPEEEGQDWPELPVEEDVPAAPAVEPAFVPAAGVAEDEPQKRILKSSLSAKKSGGRRQRSLARRIFAALAVVSAVAAVAVLVLATFIYQQSSVDEAGDTLEVECRAIASSMDGSDTDIMRFAGLDLGDVRLTYIGSDGTVLYDNENSVDEMGNHADRPEVADAMNTGTGASERESDTVGCIEVYRAVRLENGNVLRLAVTRESAMGALSHDIFLVAAVVMVVVLVCWAVSRLVVDFIVVPILDIDPANPDPASSYVELEPLVERIDEQMEELRGSELMRRQFTSNVTHELKTPLSTISGAAELIRDGIAKKEDVPEFAGRIFDEAQHMTSLVNDILTLSKLDESERSQDANLFSAAEPVDLHHVALEVVHRLSPTAHKAGISLACEGDALLMKGQPHLLDELVYNLCDNAIRYNKDGGSVRVSVAVEAGRPTLTVADTGLGIPYEAQAKVFERFFRVEGSRSRERGGTGLGLAIVKHAAAYHGAEVSLASEPNVGTTITVRFPAEIYMDKLG